MTDWPEYKSHKIVRAAPIVGFAMVGSDERDTSGRVCALVDPGDGVTEVFMPNQRVMLDGAEVGDYAMLYHDGYKSISPKHAFEEGYTRHG